MFDFIIIPLFIADLVVDVKLSFNSLVSFRGQTCTVNKCTEMSVVRLLQSVGFISGQQSSVHRLHAGRAGEGAHQPRINAIHVINM